jgi:hypothetical protein
MKSTRLKGSHKSTTNRSKDMKTMQKESGRMGAMAPAKKTIGKKTSVATKGKAWGARHRAGIKK